MADSPMAEHDAKPKTSSRIAWRSLSEPGGLGDQLPLGSPGRTPEREVDPESAKITSAWLPLPRKWKDKFGEVVTREEQEKSKPKKTPKRIPIVTAEMPSQISDVLRCPAKKVKFPLSKAQRELIDGMMNELRERKAAGFAAPQFGESWSIVVYHLTKAMVKSLSLAVAPIRPSCLINPTYEAINETDTTLDWEFSFSIMSEGGKVYRPRDIRLKAYNEDGQLIERVVSGFESRLLQHQIDHVHGILCSDLYEAGGFYGPREDMLEFRRRERVEETASQMANVSLNSTTT
eukprot:gnl/TRDRNA2_/TRDRNA2_89908_c1_seq1.p1 gnl/TRDRNA2_/TRDRNA2_89908_c1~~gnl/TRDRNA2_/TRDRNA2_89908_c1_seq1.p1  ORF type:complete len:331 (+),score=47.42 gnl/TRDRNA2_/TRDRNA2_89908_c1_seq1:126-995(+)